MYSQPKRQLFIRGAARIFIVRELSQHDQQGPKGRSIRPEGKVIVAKMSLFRK